MQERERRHSFIVGPCFWLLRLERAERSENIISLAKGDSYRSIVCIIGFDAQSGGLRLIAAAQRVPGRRRRSIEIRLGWINTRREIHVDRSVVCVD